MVQLSEITEDCMTNAKGHHIPMSKIKAIDLLRDEEVNKISSQAKQLSKTMLEAKTAMYVAFNDFVDLAFAEHDVKIGGKKGNTTLISFDGSTKVQIAISENIVFDEQLQVAKELIDQCISEWSQDSNDNIKAIINQSFQVDKEGKISTHRVLGLRSLDINDDKWLKAMKAIQDSVKITDTKEYIRVYERDEKGKYIQIPLDFASL